MLDGITQTWVTDAAKGFCKITVDASGASQLTNCLTKPTTATRFGQPAFDGKFLYLPDYGAGSTGIWRYDWDGMVFDPTNNVVNFSKLAIPKPNAIALDPFSGSLYVTVNGNNNSLFRVNNPGSTPPPATAIKIILKVPSPNGLAFVGNDLWIAEAASLDIIPGPMWANCATVQSPALCVTTQIQTGIASTTSIAFDTANNYAYVGVPALPGVGSGVWRIAPGTQVADFYTSHWVKNGTPGLYYGVTALGVDNVTVPTSVGQSNLYLVDDPTLGAGTAPVATVYQVPLGGASDAVASQQPPFPTAPTVVLSATANPAWPYFSGLTHPLSALWMGTHMWVQDATHGFCRVDATPVPPAPPGLTNCVLTTSPGLPAFDAVNNLLYTIPNTAAIGSAACIQVYVFDPGAETLTLGTVPTVSNCGPLITAANKYTPVTPTAKAPTALAFGPDGQLYMAMGGTAKVLKLTAPNPAAGAHVLTVIGNLNNVAVKSLAFYKGDLYDVETGVVNNMPAATLCQVNCQAWPLTAPAALPASLASDGTFLYVGDGAQVWKFDLAANTFTKLANTGPAGKLFGSISGLAVDPLGQVYAADQGPVWQISAGNPTNISLAPAQAQADTAQTVTITGANFLPSTNVSACPAIVPAPIVVSGVTVVSSTQITATFTLSPGPLGVCPISVTTATGNSLTADFTVTAFALPVITSITPAAGARGGALLPNPVSVIVAGTALLGATLTLNAFTLDAVPVAYPITAAITFNDGSTINASFAIPANVALGSVNVVVATPSGSNATPPAFTITAPPPTLAATPISPASGSANSTVTVTINGTGLLGSTLTLPTGITLFDVTKLPTVTATSITATLSIALAGTATSTPVTITVVAASGGNLFASFTIIPLAQLSITSTHVANFTQAQTGAVYTVKVSNATGTSPTVGPVTVTEAVSSGLTLVSMSGLNWSCPLNGNTCTHIIDGIAAGASYETIAVTVNVSAVAVSPQTNSGSVSFGNLGAVAPFTDSTAITYLLPTLTDVSPASGLIGSIALPVTFTGTNLINAAGVAGPTFGAGITVSNVNFIDTTKITAVIAINALTAAYGPQNVQVGVLGGVTNPMTFTVIPSPAVLTSIYPLQAVPGISQPVTVTGSNLLFVQGLSVFDKTGGVAAGITANIGLGSSTQIPATLVIAPTVAPGTYTIQVVTLYYSFSNALTFTVVAPPATAAAFVKTDALTHGTWKPLYGADGQAIANDIPDNYPLYAKVTLAGQTPLTWQAVATDASALQNGAGTGAIASAWNSLASFTIDINLTDGLPHQVAMYCLDWLGNNARVETIDVLDAATQKVLATTSMKSFTSGQYLVWNLYGHVTLRITPTAGDAVVSGLFFDGATGSVPPPALTLIDTPSGEIGMGVPLNVTLTGASLTGATLNLPTGVTGNITGTPTATQIVAALTIDPTAPVGLKGISVTTPGGISTPIGFTLLAHPKLSIGISHGNFTQDQTGTYTVTVTNDAASAPTRGAVTMTDTLPAGLTMSSMTGLNWTCGSSTCTRNDALAGGASYEAITVTVTVAAPSSPLTNNVSVSGGASIAASSSDTTVINFAPPTLTNISPSFGVIGTAGYVVTLTGTNFTGAILSLPTGITATSALVTPGQIIVTLNIALSTALGSPTITIVTPGGPVTGTFTVLPQAPLLASMTPPSVVIGATVPVTLTGLNLSGAILHLDPGVSATNVIVNLTGTQITATLTVGPSVPLGSAGITVTTAGGGSNTATYKLVQSDTATQGTWKPVYGAGGQAIPNDVTNYPPYAQVAMTGQIPFTWNPSTADVRATQKGVTAGRIASAWYSFTSFSIDINLTDNLTHKVAVYCLDWDTVNTRAERIDVLDFATGQVLASTPVTAYSQGQYLAWNLSGHVTLRVTRTAGLTAVVSGLFFDGGYGLLPALSSLSTAEGVIGTTVPLTLFGSNLSGASLNLGPGVTATGLQATAGQITATLAIALNAPLGPQTISVTTPGGDSGALTFTVKPQTPAATIAPATGASGTSVPVTLTGVNLLGATLTTDPLAGITATSVLATATQITAILKIAVGSPVGSQNMIVTTTGGTATVAFNVYQLAPVIASIAPATGVIGTTVPVILIGTNLNGTALTGASLNLGPGITATGLQAAPGQITASLVIAANAPFGRSNITVTTPGGASNAVTFTVVPALARTDIATQGSWKAVYGAGGQAIPNDVTNFPPYAQVAFTGQTAFTWNPSTADVRATQKGVTTGRIASAWYSFTSFNIDINLTDGLAHQVALYCLDWDTANTRAEKIDVLDPATGLVLASSPVTAYSSGQYLVWNLSGHVTLRVTRTAGQTAVVSGLFFDGGSAPPQLATVTPAFGVVGNTQLGITLVGTNLSGATLNLGAGITATGVVANANSITANLAIAATAPVGSQTISVTSLRGDSGTVTFLVKPLPPTLLSIAPALGPAGASIPVTLTGTNLLGATLNTGAGITANSVVITATKITATFAIATGATIGSQDITVSTLGGTTAAVPFNIQLPVPVLASITPAVGVVGNLSLGVNLIGTGLAGATTLNMGTGITVTGLQSADGLITATLAIALNAPVGARTISVTTLGGTSGTLTFMVKPLAPTLAAIAPAQGSGGATVPVTLTGANLLGATLSPLAGITATGVVITATKITATFTIAAGAAVGSQDIIVTTLGGVTTAVPFAVVAATGAVAIVKTDTATQGSWKQVYGNSGQAIPNDVTNFPPYAQVAFTGQIPFTWNPSTVDVRAPQKGAATDRIASAWYSFTSFNIDINLIDGLTHQVALYCLDWDTVNTRAERIDVLDTATGQVLASSQVAAYSLGQYLVLNLSGHVTLRVTRTAGQTAVVSGLFFN